jgi:hypothetical protein
MLSNALASLSAAFGKLRAALTPPPTTRVPLKSSLGFAFGYNASGVDLRENPGRPNIAIM